MPFKRIASPKRKSQEVAEQILNEIRCGIFAPGQRLPPARELAEQMGVSRTVIREALSVLQLAG